MSVHATCRERGIYLITFTCHNWLPLIQEAQGHHLVYKWFEVLQSKAHSVLGYVIMPNHVHLLLYFHNTESSLSAIIGNGKRFMAYELVRLLEARTKTGILSLLQNAVQKRDRAKGKKHEVWKDSFDCKQCRTEKFLIQKLRYNHANPRTEKSKLAARPVDYPHSSACQYLNGKAKTYAVKDYREMLAQLMLETED